MRILTTLLLAGAALQAGEYAVLHNGFRIYAESHETAGDKVLIKTGAGIVELRPSEIASWEQEDYVKPAPPPQPALALAEVAPSPKTPVELIDDAAVRHGLRPEFVRSVALAESALQPAALSPKGAIGLMQLMPGTAVELGVNPHDAAENAEGGAKYLKQLLLKYKDKPDGVRLALAAYNAGPGAVDRYRAIPPYRETQAYVERVIRQYLKQLGGS